MVVHSRNDALMCLTFSSNLNDMASNLFYSLPLCSLYSFEEITEAFLIQYAFRREAKRINTTSAPSKRGRMTASPTLATFRANCPKFPTAVKMYLILTFVSGLSLSNPLYKHLLKHDVTLMSDVLS